VLGKWVWWLLGSSKMVGHEEENWWGHHFRIVILHQETSPHTVNLVWLELEELSLVGLVILVFYFVLYCILNILVSYRLWWDFSVDVGLFKVKTNIFLSFGWIKNLLWKLYSQCAWVRNPRERFPNLYLFPVTCTLR